MRVLGPGKESGEGGTFSLCLLLAASPPTRRWMTSRGREGGPMVVSEGLHDGAARGLSPGRGEGGWRAGRTAEYSVQGPREEREGPRSLFDQPESEGIVRDSRLPRTPGAGVLGGDIRDFLLRRISICASSMMGVWFGAAESGWWWWCPCTHSLIWMG